MKEVLVGIINLLIFYMLYKELKIYNNTKKIIIKLKKTEKIRYIFIVQYIIMIGLIITCINKIKDILMWPSIEIYVLMPILGILFIYFIKDIRNMGITEKGIICYRGYYKWTNIRSYEWISSTVIKIIVEDTFIFWRNKNFMEFKVPMNQNEEIEKLLKKPYLNYNIKNIR